MRAASAARLLTLLFSPAAFIVAAHSEEQSYDFVIVGGGLAGSVLANRLSASGHHSVLLLNVADAPPKAYSGPVMITDEFIIHKNITADDGLRARIHQPGYMPVPHFSTALTGSSPARMLGGSSLVALSLYLRDHPEALDSWGEGWSWEELRPYFPPRLVQPPFKPSLIFKTMTVPAYDMSLDEMSVALSYVTMALPQSATPAAPAAPAKKEKKAKKAEEKKKEEDDDDFDVFGDDDDEEEETPKESRAEMLARLKKEAEIRTAAKEAKQRTLVGVEIKPWDTEQDLMVLWKKITKEIKQDGLKWAEGCTLQEVAFGIKKIVTTFVMGAKNSSDDVVEAIEAMEDEVQSVEVTSMNVL